MQVQWNKPRFDDAGARIIALTTDSVTKNKRIAESLGISFSILSDPDGTVLRRIGMWNPRWDIAARGFLILAPDLHVVSRHRGPWEATPETIRFFLKQVGGPGSGSS